MRSSSSKRFFEIKPNKLGLHAQRAVSTSD
jgi:hypothetical protein